jgi:hypothetical protein
MRPQKAKMSALDRYLIIGMRRVEGWLFDYSPKFIAGLSEVQRSAGYSGAVGEIGVHHGKLFILLLLTSSGTEKAFAVDVFENQHLNTDGSGRGDRGIFLANIRRWAGSDERVAIIARSSLEIGPEDILAASGRARLVSVDGGHTEECTLNDLVLAQSVLHDAGVVILDDYFNQGWPDVSAGVAKYLARPESKLRPFAISPNKVYFTDPRYAAFYRAEMRRKFAREKESRMFGSAVDIYGILPPKPTLAWFIKERVKKSQLGIPLLTVKAFLERK